MLMPCGTSGEVGLDDFDPAFESQLSTIPAFSSKSVEFAGSVKWTTSRVSEGIVRAKYSMARPCVDSSRSSRV